MFFIIPKVAPSITALFSISFNLIIPIIKSIINDCDTFEKKDISVKANENSNINPENKTEEKNDDNQINNEQPNKNKKENNNNKNNNNNEDEEIFF